MFQSWKQTVTSRNDSQSNQEMFLSQTVLMMSNRPWPPPVSTKLTSRKQMIHLMQLPEDMALRPCQKPIQRIMLTTHQMRRLSEQATSIQKDTHLRFTDQEIQAPNLQPSQLWKSILTSKTRPTSTDLDKVCLIIAQATWWTQLFGIPQTGWLRKTFTQTSWELNTESSSISQSRSTIEQGSSPMAECFQSLSLMNR